jgi:hypothetical protein
MNTKSMNRTAGIILLIEGLLIFVPMIVLGAAINWPASLDEPASVVLPAILEQADATRIGYFAYLIYSVLFFPVVALVVRATDGNESSNLYSRLALGFGAASALARTIGIIRWLVAMPALAQAYNAPGVTAQTQDTISLIYNTLNNYGGSIGEILGVSIFAAISVFMISALIFQNKGLPAWSGYFALISAVSLLIPALEIFGIDAGVFLTASVAVVQFWFLFVGFYLLFRQPQTQARAVAYS